MATEKRKIHRVIDAAGTLVQVLPETSAEQVTLADAGNKFTSTNVEGALQELATSVANAGKVDDVQDVKGASIVKNKIAKLTKDAVGLNYVDNTADANKSVKHATSADSATTATSATTANSATKATQDASGNVITSTYATKTELQEGLAGKSQSKTYNNYQAFVTAVNAMNNTALKVGDNVFIVTPDVPDMWVSAVNSSSATYTYSSDSAIVTALGSTNGLTVGYYVFRELETQKVDLTPYQTKTDNSLATADKTVVGAINEVKDTADSALSKANANATEIANIKNGTNGTKVKYAEHADTANSADKVANKFIIGRKIDATNILPIAPIQYDGSKEERVLFSENLKTETKEYDGVSYYEVGVNNVPNILKIWDGVDNDKAIRYDGSEAKELKFDAESFNSSSHPVGTRITVALKDMLTDVNPTAQYSAVKVDAKGRITAVGKSIEWGASGQTTPSGDLMLGGLFMELQ